MVEVSDGGVSIDGVDVRWMGLHHLRSRLAVIPQDPVRCRVCWRGMTARVSSLTICCVLILPVCQQVIFSGSLRENMDPLSQHSDGKVQQVKCI